MLLELDPLAPAPKMSATARVSPFVPVAIVKAPTVAPRMKCVACAQSGPTSALCGMESWMAERLPT